MWSRLQYFARETTISLRRNLLMTISGILTVAVSLALFGGIMLLSKWVDHGTEQIKGGVRLEAFMVVKATDTQIADVQQAIEDDPQIKDYRFLTKEDTYEVFKTIFRKDPDLVKNVDAESLPTSFRIVPREAEFTNPIKRRLQPLAGIDTVETPGDALRGLLSATDTATLVFFFLSGVLLFSSVFLIINTIRLATFARRREIEVMKLVGASNWFVRVPFMAEGLVQGLIGAALAIGVVFTLKLGFDSWFDSPRGFFKEFYLTTADAVQISILVLVGGVVIGLVGAVVGLWRFLRV